GSRLPPRRARRRLGAADAEGTAAEAPVRWRHAPGRNRRRRRPVRARPPCRPPGGRSRAGTPARRGLARGGAAGRPRAGGDELRAAGRGGARPDEGEGDRPACRSRDRPLGHRAPGHAAGGHPPRRLRRRHRPRARDRAPRARSPCRRLTSSRGSAEPRLPSVAARAVVRGETALDLAVGVADAASAREATTDDQYRIGSITKTFTAAAVLELVEQRRLALDDPLGRHVREVGDRPLTIRRLLSHASGLQREPVGAVWETLEFPSMEELLAQLDEAEQVLEPATGWHYSNLAFALLGVLVTRVAGVPYEQFVRERLLDPLGLGRTTWERAEPAARGYFVDPYADVLRPEAELGRLEGV